MSEDIKTLGISLAAAQESVDESLHAEPQWDIFYPVHRNTSTVQRITRNSSL